MPDYLFQVSYTPEAWANLLKYPQNRLEAVQPVVERLGGSITGAWMAFGEYDAVLLIHMPDNVTAAAFAMAVSAGRAVKICQTTPLMSLDAGVEAMRKAAAAGYRPPGG
jgi:uncharacterized protein with GYD domain